MSWWARVPMGWRLRLVAHGLALGAFVLAALVAHLWGHDAAAAIVLLMLIACAGLVWAIVLQVRHGFNRPYGDG